MPFTYAKMPNHSLSAILWIHPKPDACDTCFHPDASKESWEHPPWKLTATKNPLKIGKLAPKIFLRSAIVFQPSPFFLVYNSYYNLRKLVSFREGFWCKLAQVGFREGFWLACFVPPHSLKAVWASSSLSGSSSSPSWSQPFQLMLRFFPSKCDLWIAENNQQRKLFLKCW